VGNKPITAYKVLKKRKYNYYSPVYMYPYKLNNGYYSPIGYKQKDLVIESGFHLYKTLDDALYSKYMKRGDSYFVYSAIMPRMANYYENDTEYVTDKVMYKKLPWYLRLWVYLLVTFTNLRDKS
jgi:hypothetical protein